MRAIPGEGETHACVPCGRTIRCISKAGEVSGCRLAAADTDFSLGTDEKQTESDVGSV